MLRAGKMLITGIHFPRLFELKVPATKTSLPIAIDRLLDSLLDSTIAAWGVVEIYSCNGVIKIKLPKHCIVFLFFFQVSD